MSVFLSVLFMIGKILLILLLVILVLLLVILFVPVRFKIDADLARTGLDGVDADIIKQNLNASALVSWFFKAVRGSFSFNASGSGEIDFSVKALCFTLFPREKKRKKSKKNKSQKDASLSRNAKEAQEIGEKAKSCMAQPGETENEEREEREEERKEAGEKNIEEAKGEKKGENEETEEQTGEREEAQAAETEEGEEQKNEGTTTEEISSATDVRQSVSKENRTLSEENKISIKSEKTYKNKRDFADKDKGIFCAENIAETLSKAVSKVQTARDKLSMLKTLTETDSFERGKNVLFKQLKRLLKGLLPKKCDILIYYGLGDPKATAEALALYGILYPVLAGRVRVRPDFNGNFAELSAHLEGRITVFTVATCALIVYFNKDLRKLKKRFDRIMMS